jgi:hypothetical protein
MRHALLIGTCVLVMAGCSRPAASTAALRTAGPGVTGREVRYNAVLALAHRGSERVKDDGVWDVLLEMLDEDQQLRNYTPRTGPAVPDETAARTTVLSALHAVQELHTKRPKLDLSDLRDPIDKLAQSPNAVVSVRAKQAQQALFPPP